MDNPLDRYDTHAVFLPGFLTLCEITYFYHRGNWEHCLTALKGLNFGDALFIIFLSYFVGLILMIFIVKAENCIFRLLYDGDPFSWIYPSKDRKARAPWLLPRQSTACEMIDKKNLDRLLRTFENHLGKKEGANFSVEEIATLFTLVKNGAYRVEEAKDECLKMLSKSHMHLGLALLTLVFGISQFFCPGEIVNCISGVSCDIIKTLLTYLLYAAPFFLSLCFLNLFISFNIKYNRHLYHGYITLLPEEVKPAPSPHLSETGTIAG